MVLEPVFGGLRFGVSKRVFEQRGSSFYISKDTFYRVPIPVCFVLESEAMSMECGVEPWRAIDEEFGVFDVVVRSELAEEVFGQCFRSRRVEACKEDIVCLMIGSGIEPELFAIDFDHALVEGNLVR